MRRTTWNMEDFLLFLMKMSRLPRHSNNTLAAMMIKLYLNLSLITMQIQQQTLLFTWYQTALHVPDP